MGLNTFTMAEAERASRQRARVEGGYEGGKGVREHRSRAVQYGLVVAPLLRMIPWTVGEDGRHRGSGAECAWWASAVGWLGGPARAEFLAVM